MGKLRRLQGSVHNLTKGGTGRSGGALAQMVIAMLSAGSVVLSEMARSVSTDKRSFLRVVNRYSRVLAAAGDAVRIVEERYLRRAGAWTSRGFDVIGVDGSEIVKPYGRKMEHLCQVRDASESRRDKAVLKPGWWLTEIVATAADHRVLPLFRQAYSSAQPSYRSASAATLAAITRVAPYVAKNALWVFDRGFDARAFMAPMSKQITQWAVRQRGDRHATLEGAFTPDGRPVVGPLSELAHAAKTEYVAQPQVSNRGILERTAVCFGYLTVRLPWSAAPLTLIVSRFGTPDAPSQGMILLLTSVRPRNPLQARRVVEAYFRRWGAEDQIRGAKQNLELEDVRVLSWERLQNLLTLTTVATGLLALAQLEHPRAVNAAMRQAPIVGPVPPFILYRLFAAFRAALRDLSTNARVRLARH